MNKNKTKKKTKTKTVDESEKRNKENRIDFKVDILIKAIHEQNHINKRARARKTDEIK